MRHTSRLGASLRYVSLPVVVLIFSFILGRGVRGQAPSASSPLLDQRVTSPAFPATWNDGVKALAEKITAAVKPSRAISLEIKNISSLGASEVEAVRVGLEKELTDRGLQLGSSGTGVEVTLSENVEGLIWVAEIAEEKRSHVEIVSIARPPTRVDNAEKASVTLSRELIWQQPAMFLDFSVFYGIPGATYSMLVILEPDRLNYYESRNADWSTFKSVNFPNAEPKQRDPVGAIAKTGNMVYAPGVRCTGEVENPAKLECALWKDRMLRGARIQLRFPGHDDNDVTAAVADRCGNRMVAVTSGNGDWTQPDSLQAYFVGDFREDAEPSGNAVTFDGPVLALHEEGQNTMRAIVHNLKTGNYEGYVVTATCNH
jgi:hypothetical protein